MANAGSTEQGYESEIVQLRERFRAAQAIQAMAFDRLVGMLAGQTKTANTKPRICLDVDVYVDGKLQTGMTENMIKALSPEKFELFLNLIELRLGFCVGKRHELLDEGGMRGVELRSRHLSLLEQFLVKQGHWITNVSVQKRKDHELYWVMGTMSTAVHYLRWALGDKKPWRYIVCSSANSRNPGEGWAYRIPVGVHTCLIRRAER